MKEEAPPRKPLGRSVSFWLGACVTGFLLWVWVDSMRNVTGVHATNLVRSVSLQLGQSILSFRVSHSSFPDDWVENPRFRPPPLEWSFRRAELAREHAEASWWFAPSEMSVDRRGFERHFRLEIPCWCLLLVWLTLFGAGAAIRRRWRRRRMAREEVP